MVQTLTKERVEVERISLEQLGEMVGLPIVVRPWWGSVRNRFIQASMQVEVGDSGVSEPREVGRQTHLQWVCPGGSIGNQKKNPEAQNGVIVLWEGPCRLKTPYRTRHGYGHTHAQKIELKSVGDQAMLILIRVSGPPSQFLLGRDGQNPYTVQVPCRLNTVIEALDWLMPRLVREAVAQGLDVKRQGDWYFIPRDKPPVPTSYCGNVYGSSPGLKTNLLYRGVPLVFNSTQTRHTGGLVIYQTILGVNGPAPMVKGNVKAPDHPTLHLGDWHTGVRNRSHPWRNASHQRRRFDD